MFRFGAWCWDPGFWGYVGVLGFSDVQDLGLRVVALGLGLWRAGVRGLIRVDGIGITGIELVLRLPH